MVDLVLDWCSSEVQSDLIVSCLANLFHLKTWFDLFKSPMEQRNDSLPAMIP